MCFGRDRIALAAATCGGVGYLPWAPGTAATFVGAALALLTEADPAWQWGLLAATALAGLAAIPAAQRALGARDPREIVVDEVAGALVTFIALPMTLRTLFVGFAAFRLLDILKPWPLRRLERLPGAWGVLADDLAAGALAHVAVWAALAR